MALILSQICHNELCEGSYCREEFELEFSVSRLVEPSWGTKSPKTEWKSKTKFWKKYALGIQSKGVNWQKKEPGILPILEPSLEDFRA